MSDAADDRAPSFAPSGFFVLRTPLLPLETLLAWSSDAGGDRVRLRAALDRLLDRPHIREAIFVASPSLQESLAAWRAEPDGERGQKVERALVRYLSRMCGRSTPFGLFAGSSMGRIGEETALQLGPRHEYVRRTRLDGDYVFALTEALARDPSLRGELRFRVNSSVYAVGDRLRYAEARLAGRWRRYRLVAVEASDALSILIERAQAGARVAELVDALLRWDRSLEPEDAQDFVVAAIEAQLLVAELGPAVTGDAVGLDQLVRDLEAVPAAASLRRALVEVHASLSRQDAAGVGAPVEGYLAIATRLQDLPVEVELSRLFQVDLAKPAPDATLGREPLAEITRGVELLWQIGSVPRNPHLEEFRAAFFARFEEREVPLGEALDEESGIGFGGGSDRGDAAPLLDGLHFPASGRDGKGSSWQERHAQLLRRVDELRRSGGRILELDEADVRELRSPARAPLPDSFSVSATLVAASAEELRRGAFQVYLPGMMGPSGANLIGRFCYLDPQLTERVIANLRAEEAQRPDAIFAEIVHLPEGRVGNLVMRPRLRTHEIAFLGRSGAPPQQQIPLGDLSVLLDRGRIVLRSRRLGCEIIPRLTTAHNFVHGQNLGVYRFLCALQHQGVTAALGWSWGPLESAPFLPRVTSGRLVLALARWRIAGACLHAVGAASDAETLERMRALRAERGIPRLAALEDGDNVLPLDLDNILVVRSLLQLVARRPFVTLTEWFPEPAQACAHGPEGRYAHELIIPFESRRPSAPAAVRPRAATAAAATTRSLPPGSEWLYVKLFTGTATADRLLREMIAPTVRWATTAGATGWFFIRYDEHGHHLRLRVRGEPSWLLSELLPRLTEATRPWRDGGLIWRMQIDTYERELERYGGARGIELAESLFRADSEAVLRQLEIVGADGGGDLRWQLALAGVDRLLADFALSPSEKHDLARRLRADFGNEFRADVTLSRELGDKFRRLRPQLEALLDEDATGPGIETLRARSAEVRPLVGELRARHERRELGVSPAELAASFSHMHVNRMLRSAQRAHELVLYDFLTRIYEGRLARARKTVRPREESSC